MNLSARGTFFLAAVIVADKNFGTKASVQEFPRNDGATFDRGSSAFLCKGEGRYGRCFCNSPGSSDARIFGWSWLEDVGNMTCACSRHRQGSVRNDVSLHCTENGSYEKLQCDDGVCWCVEEKSGRPSERVYPRSMMRHLPCYTKKPSYLRQRYDRQCESAALAREAVLRKLRAHGTSNIHIDMPLCDYDGSYAKHKISGKLVQCVGKDGKQIGQLQAAVGLIDSTNCNCARDSVLYADEELEFLMTCASNGNYDSVQWSNGMQYCVDEDGFATGDLAPPSAAADCS